VRGAESTSSIDASDLAARLEIDVDDVAICHACLSLVSIPLGRGDERGAVRATERITADLWDEGLALPARLALERARGDGVPGADAGLADIAARQARSVTARAIVLHLATELSARAKGDLMRMGFERWPSRGE
jgi:hypothetical protein